MEDGSININTDINTDGLKRGLNEIEKQTDAALKDISSSLKTISAQIEQTTKKAANTQEKSAKEQVKSNKGLIESISDVKGGITALASSGGSVAAIAGPVGIAAVAVGGLVKGLNECAAAYKVQEKAEQRLANAIRNNPYVDSTAETQIKEFASGLQKTSEIGDEVSISLGGMLVASGKDANQTMQILQTAADLAAGSTMEFEQAVEALNASFTGSAGELEDLLPAIGQLSEEELRSGKAVDMLSEKFKGFAENTADAGVQLKNAWGDFKENIGRGWDAAVAPIKRALTGALSSVNEAISDHAVREEAETAIDEGTAEVKHYNDLIRPKQEDVDYHKKQIEQWDKEIAEKQKILDETGDTDDFLIQKSNTIISNDIRRLNNSIRDTKELISQLEKEIADLEKDRQPLLDAEAAEKSAAEAEAEREAALQEQIQNDRDALDIINRHRDARAEEIRLLEERAKIEGKEINQRDKLNILMNNYMSLISENPKLVTTENWAVKELAEEIYNQAKVTEEYEGAIESLEEAQAKFQQSQAGFKSAVGDAYEASEDATSGQMKAILYDLDKAYGAVIQSSLLNKEARAELVGQYKNARAELGKLIKDAQEAEAADKAKKVFGKGDRLLGEEGKESGRIQAYLEELDGMYAEEIAKLEENSELKLALVEEYEQKKRDIEKKYQKTKFEEDAEELNKELEKYAGYTEKFESIINESTAIAKQAVDAETDEEMASLAEQYTQGLISYEEYEAGKEEIQKKAAKKQYQLDMANWAASLLTAGINVALGISSALSTGSTAEKAINAALVGALGAVQIAAIVANKPQPPSFAAGGIVPGRSYSGDRVQANVNSGEMILNAAQQRNLWDMANGSPSPAGGAVINMPVTIENRASGSVQAQPSMTESGLRIVIDNLVNSSMQQGRYTESMGIAQSRAGGLTYL